MYRTSYINVFLIQSRGFVQNPLYTRYTERKDSFPEYRRIQGHFSECCDNYKWPDVVVHCHFPIVISLNSDSSSSDDDDDENEDVKSIVRQQDTSRTIEDPGVTTDYPIVIE